MLEHSRLPLVSCLCTQPADHRQVPAVALPPAVAGWVQSPADRRRVLQVLQVCPVGSCSPVLTPGQAEGTLGLLLQEEGSRHPTLGGSGKAWGQAHERPEVVTQDGIHPTLHPTLVPSFEE